MAHAVFGENLPDRFFERLMDFRRAQVLLVMGTSLVVCVVLNPGQSLRVLDRRSAASVPEVPV